MSKIQFSESKTIKLQNVLTRALELEDEEVDFNLLINKMQSYIKVKGTTQVGPLIQYIRAFSNENEELDMEIIFMLQCNTFVHSIEKPYRMESIIRVPNCMYCRYIGPEDKLSFAYQKIQLEAFENDIPLKGDSYTVFVDRNEEDETITADVFMERADE